MPVKGSLHRRKSLFFLNKKRHTRRSSNCSIKHMPTQIWSCFMYLVWAHKDKSIIQVFGRFHVKGPRKKVNVKKWIFVYEMWKIIGKIDDFDRVLNNSYNLGVFLAKNQKYPKMTVLKKWKLKKRRKNIEDWKTYFKYHIKHSYSMNFMIFEIFLSFAMF